MNSEGTRLQSVVCIFSAAHGGSTLLSLMIGSHSKAFYIGEFHALPRWLNENQKCGCGSHIKECNFWRTVRNRYRFLHGLDFFQHPKRLPIYYSDIAAARNRHIWKLLNGTTYLGAAYRCLSPLEFVMRLRWQKLVRATLDLYNVINEVSGSKIIVDSTKNYFRIYKLSQACPHLIKVLCLVRDGRAVSYSNINKRGLPMHKAAKTWRNTYVRGARLLFQLPRENRLFLKYEDICNNPERYAERVAQFLSIKFEQNMLDISKGLCHSIAGNKMKWKPNNTIKLNDRWKTALSLQDLRCFESIAGDINRTFGYPHYSHSNNSK